VPITTKVVLFESRSLRGAFDKTPCDKVCRQFDALKKKKLFSSLRDTAIQKGTSCVPMKTKSQTFP
jgi:hypothetical protein